MYKWNRFTQKGLAELVWQGREKQMSTSIFRMASSGISQLVDDRGVVKATAPFPGEDAMITGSLELAKQGRVPLDRHLAQASVWISALLVGWLAWHRLRRRMF